ncbi:acyl-CoA thioesterase [Camelimonas fluminis]|uniref:Thioesterase family protein n=1 Tax=Camelimonas fluminis TaxID=1576911 RepID=A0ABV7UCZ7_9HYPH|nr:thioesterase family protein [Camelimonas fluminis]GHE46699.1 acyl-CoA thioesterase [Camelimonas fluminis]
MTPFSTLMAGMTPAGDGFSTFVSEDWQQGRTTYGGMSAALCAQAAALMDPELPPLRSAQFSFIGPASGALEARPALLRRGKSAACIGVDLVSDQGVATRAMLTYGAARESRLRYHGKPYPRAAAVEDSADFFGGRQGPAFSRHFEFRTAGGVMPMSGSAEPEYLIWLRHRDEAAGSSAASLLALTDAPPPTAMALLREFGPISTMTWMVDFTAEAHQDTHEWRLLRMFAEDIGEGYSTQETAVWSPSGKLLAIARQTIALFV